MAAAKLKTVGLVMLSIGVGVAIGVVANPKGLIHLLPAAMGNTSAAPRTDEAKDAHGGGKHIELTAQARHNLGLETGRAVLADYYHTLRVPGVIREKPGHSDHSVPTTVHGIIKKVHAVPGQTVKPGDPLFDLQLTGEALASAQAGLLDLLKQLDTIDEELERIRLLADSGLAKKRKLELGYERKRLDGQRDVRAQELLVRGLLPAQVKEIIRDKKLIRQFTVFVPQEFADEQLSADTETPSKRNPTAESPADALAQEEMQFTIETLDVFPGKAVRPGDSLCHLAYHAVLYIEGQAFENEIEAIGKLRQNGWTANLEFGTQGHESVTKGARILYLDNHVDPDSQTFSFYMRLDNEVLQETRGEQGELYRSWKYKPGQRVHIVIPVKKWERQMTLPLKAVVQEGPDAFIFRRIARMRTDDGKSFVDEFEQVPVRILHQDTKVAVVASDGEVHPGDIVALNNAYQLQLTLTSSKGGGGHSHHGHSH
jgi:multidrug efflux pump subunit AcrA (membrane-fusion protein)